MIMTEVHIIEIKTENDINNLIKLNEPSVLNSHLNQERYKSDFKKGFFKGFFARDSALIREC